MKKEVRSRLRIVAVVLLAVAGLLVLRLYFVQLVKGKEYALRADRQYVSSSQELFTRGSIYFTRKDGTLISAAALQTGYIISIQPSKITRPEAVYEQINAITPIDASTWAKAIARVEDPYEVLARRVEDTAGRKVAERNIPGVTVTRERWRIYPANASAAQSIGFIGYNNDNVIGGHYGLERYYNDVLDRDSVGLFGNFFAELFANLDSIVVDAHAARQGDLVTSIEPVVQQKLDEVVAKTNQRYGSSETGIIIMDPKTGEILALDTYPTFNANNSGKENATYFGNPLVQSQYEFGSIMKALTMTAGLDAGVITPSSTYTDTGCRTVNNKTFCNYDHKARGPGTPMQQVLSQSLNMGASYIADRLGHQRFLTYFNNLGFGTETGIDLPSEIKGSIGEIKSNPRDVAFDTASYGQGVATTPVQMIKALGALANHGVVVTPHLVKAKKLENGISRTVTWDTGDRVFSAKATEETTRMLVEVVDVKLGGGKVKIPEMSVAAKTGTAQLAINGTYEDEQYFHSFMGYFPAYEPRFIILLYTKQPHGVKYASETLTDPFFELTHFLINYYSVPPDRVP